MPVRRVLAALAAASLVGLYGFYWRHAEAAFVAAIDARRADLAAAGLPIMSGPIETGGFPLMLRAVVPALEAGTSPRIAIPRLVLWARPWSGSTFRMDLPEGATLAMAAAPDRPGVTISHLSGSASIAPGRLELALAAGRIAVAGAPVVLGPAITGLSVDAAVEGRSIGREAQDGAARSGIDRWRDEGGIVRIGRASMNWGPVDASLDGTLALDTDLSPLAAATVTIGGWRRLLDALVAAGITAPPQAVRTRALIDALPTGEDGRVTTSLTLQDGQIWLDEQAIGAVPDPPWRRAGG